jgi:hypothetical protein
MTDYDYSFKDHQSLYPMEFFNSLPLPRWWVTILYFFTFPWFDSSPLVSVVTVLLWKQWIFDLLGIHLSNMAQHTENGRYSANNMSRKF